MRFYAFTDIEAAGDCVRFARECLGWPMEGDRIQAQWRGGRGFNVALNQRGWIDHKTKEKGGIIKLCAMAKFGGNIQEAQEFLGDWLNLTPQNTTVRLTYDYRRQSTRYAELVQRGYHEVCRYTYRNAQGTDIHYVVRMEHPTERKQFIQCTPYSGSLKGVETVLYNLPAVSGSDWAIVVEGEKDADTLIALGLPATTCNNGSDHWKDSYTETLRGKDVVICRDNDEAGNDHAHLLLRSLAGAAKSLRVICPSKQPKGDVTDWMRDEGGNAKKLMAMLAKAPLISPEEAMWSDEALALYRAKAANEKALANYVTEWKVVRGKEKAFENPRTALDLVEDAHTRFLGFPRRLGKNTLFDHDRDTGRIEILPNNASVFAWMNEKSRHPVMWKPGVGFVTKDEFFHALLRNTLAYEKVSDVPNFPMRPDVYYTYRDTLKPSKDHEALRGLMSFFNPEDDMSLALMTTMIVGMMYYKPGIQRPCWIIDSRDGQAAGKTTFAELACYLYRCSPIKTNVQELNHDAKELNKRLVSVTGRNSMMLLVDNVRGVFDNSYFSDLVTGFSISGKAPYGIGEESRPNDLTYVITSNSASIGSDIASRSFIFFVARPQSRDGDWKSRVLRYIDRFRYDILGDVYDILANGTPAPERFTAKTRVPEFEAEVLYKVCGSQERYDRVMDYVMASRSDANVDEERANLIVEALRDGIARVVERDVDTVCAFIRTAVVNLWLRDIGGRVDAQDLRNMVNTGKVSCILPSVKIYPRNHRLSHCARGVLFVGDRPAVTDGAVDVPILTVSGRDNVKVVHTVRDEMLGAEILRRREERKSAENPFIDVESADAAALPLVGGEGAGEEF